MKLEAQITDYHCVPACLRMVVPVADIFTQEEIGYFCGTTKEGTDIEGARNFVNMMGYELVNVRTIPLTKSSYIVPAIIDYVDDDGEDHWGVFLDFGANNAIYDPYYDGIRYAHEIGKIHAIYCLEPYDV